MNNPDTSQESVLRTFSCGIGEKTYKRLKSLYYARGAFDDTQEEQEAFYHEIMLLGICMFKRRLERRNGAKKYILNSS